MTEPQPNLADKSRGEVPPDQAPTADFPQAAFTPGSKISGRYRIDEFLGRGAFGEVYRAHDEMLGREIALKAFVLKTRESQDQVEAALEEARTIARLDHPNIVPVYDVGREGNAAWMAMRLVKGEGLDVVLTREGKIDAKRAVHF